MSGGTPAGSYPIHASYGGTSSFSASSDASATLTILKATPTITWINPADITQGTALGPTQLNATANIPGAFKYTPASGTVLLLGPAQLLAVNFTPTDATDYNAASSFAKINVTAVALSPLTITASNATRQYGQTTPPLNNVTYTGFATGDTPASLTGTLTCTSSAKSSSPVDIPHHLLWLEFHKIQNHFCSRHSQRYESTAHHHRRQHLARVRPTKSSPHRLVLHIRERRQPRLPRRFSYLLHFRHFNKLRRRQSLSRHLLRRHLAQLRNHLHPRFTHHHQSHAHHYLE